jgi:hypothetical protein
MSTDDMNIVTLVRMMMRGIRTDTPIDPLQAAAHFEQVLQTNLDLMYTHRLGAGYVHDDSEPVLYAEFTVDGVTFDEHHEHDDTLRVIQCALHTLTHCEQMHLQLQQTPDDDDSESDEWV